MKSKVDPITLEVIRSGLVSLSQEIGIAMERAAYSEIFTDGLDYSCATFDGKGQMVAMHAFDPCHLSSMDLAVSWVLEEVGPEAIEPGDIWVQNDPYRGGSHVNDLTIMNPVFEKGELVGIPALRAHVLDMGGPVPGNFNSEASEIFQEGLRIPPVKVYEKGKEVKGIWDLITANVRDPRSFKGDLRAMVGAVKIGERRVTEYVRKYGIETWKNACEEIINASEKWMRTEIAAIPEGAYEYEQSLDDAGTSVRPRIKVKITVKNDMLVADYEGSSKQTDSLVNATWAVTACHTYIGVLDSMGIKGALAFNSGITRPMKVIAPPGTIVNPDYPAAVEGGNSDVAYRIVGAVIGAMAQAVSPERIKADCQGTGAISTCGGVNPETGQPWVNLLYWGGGTGARISADGNNGMQPIATNNKNHIIEVLERSVPIMFETYSLLDDSPGPGQNRGGVGTRIAWTLHAPNAILSGFADRHLHSPYGIYGGLPPNPLPCGHYCDTRIRIKGEHDFKHVTDLFGVASVSKFAGAKIHEGDTLETIVTGGGGYGDPLDRAPERVLWDVKNGYVSAESAKKFYGVDILGTRPEDMRVDVEATKKLRNEMRGRRE